MKAQKKNSQQFHHMDNQTYNNSSNDPCDDSQDLKTPTAENQQSLIEHKIVGDGSSSNSESSLGSSSGYGSQNTVKVDDSHQQQIQKQKQSRIGNSEGPKQQNNNNQGSHQHPTDAFAAAHHQHTNQIPAPMTLLDSTQYNQNYQETIVLSHNTLPHQYCRSQSHPSSNEVFVGDPRDYIHNNTSLQRPYSFTDGEVKDFIDI